MTFHSMSLSPVAQVYCLINPQTQAVFYVGCTKHSLNVRLSAHLASRNTIKKRSAIINSILDAGHRPEILLLDSVDFWDATLYENFYVDLFKSFGFTLYQNRRSDYTVSNWWRYYNMMRASKQKIPEDIFNKANALGWTWESYVN